MAIVQAITTSWKKEVMEALHDFNASGGNTFKLALYTSSAVLNATTTAYSATNEVTGTNYSAGGGTLTNIDPASSGTTGFVDFADLAFANVTISGIRGALIYNSTNGDRAVCVLDFGADKSPSAQTFTVVFPAADATNAIIRIA